MAFTDQLVLDAILQSHQISPGVSLAQTRAQAFTKYGIPYEQFDRVAQDPRIQAVFPRVKSLAEVMAPWMRMSTTDAGESYYFDGGTDPQYAITAARDAGFTFEEIAEFIGYTSGMIDDWYLLDGQGSFEGKRFWVADQEKIKQQLKDIQKLTNTNFDGSRDAEWHYTDLAVRMAIFDIKDVRELGVREVSGRPQYFNRRTNVIISGIGENDKGAFASTRSGEGYSWYLVQFTNTGIPIFSVKKFKNSSVFPMLIGIALAFIGVPAFLGAAVLGTATATAYPLLAQAIGNLAVQTVLSGGDFENAIKGSIAGIVAGYAGGAVGAYTDIQALGTVTGAATKAAILGKDVDKAVLTALAGVKITNEGGTMDEEYIPGYFDDWNPDLGQTGADWWSDGFPDWGAWDTSGEWAGLTFGDLGMAADPGIDVSPEYLADWGITSNVLLPDAAGNLFNVGGEYVELEPSTWASYLYFDEVGNVRDPGNNIIMTAEEGAMAVGGGSGNDDTDNNNFLTALYGKVSGLQNTLLPTQGNSGMRPASAPNGAATTKVPAVTDFWSFAAAAFQATMNYKQAKLQVQRYGSVYPTYPTGTGSVYPQVTGMPITRADGSTVVNNGNGTITTTYPTGQKVTTPTTPTIGASGQLIPGVSNTVLLAGAAVAVGALFLLKNR